jgi:hypothetical protein
MMMQYLTSLGPWYLVDFIMLFYIKTILLPLLLIATPVLWLTIVLALLYIAMLSGLSVIVFN